jgi:hypothetical protein
MDATSLTGAAAIASYCTVGDYQIPGTRMINTASCIAGLVVVERYIYQAQ